MLTYPDWDNGASKTALEQLQQEPVAGKNLRKVIGGLENFGDPGVWTIRIGPYSERYREFHLTWFREGKVRFYGALANHGTDWQTHT